MNKSSVYETLSQVNVNDMTEEKNGLTYLSWAHAWNVLKQYYPNALFEKHINPDNGTYLYGTPLAHFVTVSVIVENITVTEAYPVLDNRNKPVENPSAFEINNALQRGLAKCIGYHGLGIYLYAGEDLPFAPEKVIMVSIDGSDGPSMRHEDVPAWIEGEMQKLDTVKNLVDFWNANHVSLNHVKRAAPDVYGKIVAHFTARKKGLTNAE